MIGILCYIFGHKRPQPNFFDGNKSKGLCPRCEKVLLINTRGKWVICKETNKDDFVRYYNS